QPTHSQHTGLHEVPPRDAVASPARAADDSQHEPSSPRTKHYHHPETDSHLTAFFPVGVTSLCPRKVATSPRALSNRGTVCTAQEDAFPGRGRSIRCDDSKPPV